MSTKSTTIEDVAGQIANDCLGMRVRLLNRRVTSVYDDAFRPVGMTASQVTILVSVVSSGGGLAAVELGQLLSIEKSTLSRNLRRMEKEGWIHVKSEGREQRITASTLGKTVLRKALPLWEEAQKKTRRLLGQQEARGFKEMVNTLRSKEAKK